MRQQKKSLRVANILNLIAQNASSPEIANANSLVRVTECIQKREVYREQMAGRTQVLTLEPLKHHKTNCTRVLVVIFQPRPR